MPWDESFADESSATARLILRYGASGIEILAVSLVDAHPPVSDLLEEPDGDGAWLVVRDAAGTVVQVMILPDPRCGHEAIADEGRFDREHGGDSDDLTHSIEVAWPGPGASFEVHLSASQEGEWQEGARRGTGTLVGGGTLNPEPMRRASGEDLIDVGGPGTAGPGAKTLLFLPDGFTESEMDTFRQAVDRVVAAIATTQPFAAMMPSLRLARVDVPSRESGIGERARDTAFRSRFTTLRRVEADQQRAAEAIERYCSGTSAVALICVNATEYGGSGGAATVFSMDPVWMTEIAIHELGHSWFRLADEYSAAGTSASDKPVEANVSGTADRAKLKWAAQVDTATLLPTRDNVPERVIGAFEGAKYKDKGLFRPAFDCKMRTPGVPFCGVCENIIRAELSRHA